MLVAQQFFSVDAFDYCFHGQCLNAADSWLLFRCWSAPLRLIPISPWVTTTGNPFQQSGGHSAKSNTKERKEAA